MSLTTRSNGTRIVAEWFNSVKAELDNNGIGKEYQSKAEDYTAVITDGVLGIDAGSTDVTITLPTAVGNSGKEYCFVAEDISNAAVVDANGTELINGDANYTFSAQYEAFVCISDGTGWAVKSDYVKVDGVYVSTQATQTLTNKTLTSPTITSGVLNTSLSGTAVLDEDDMTSNSDSKVCTQQSIKAYVDSAVSGGAVHTVSSDYTVLDGDGYSTILVDDTSTDRTINLPTAADNDNRVIAIKNISTDKGKVAVDGEGGETIDGFTTIDLDFKQSFIEIACDGSNWHIQGTNLTAPQKSYDLTVSGPTGWSTTKAIAAPQRDIEGNWFATGNIAGTASSIAIYTLTVTGLTTESTAGNIQAIAATQVDNNAYYNTVVQWPHNGNILYIRFSSASTTCYVNFAVYLKEKPSFVE